MDELYRPFDFYKFLPHAWELIYIVFNDRVTECRYSQEVDKDHVRVYIEHQFFTIPKAAYWSDRYVMI